MARFDSLVEELVKFRKDRDWKKFHKPKDVAIALSIESSELMQEFLWKSDDEVEQFINENKTVVADEIADISAYLFLLAKDLDIDLFEAVKSKIKKNAKKYPVEKCKGIATKYNKL